MPIDPRRDPWRYTDRVMMAATPRQLLVAIAVVVAIVGLMLLL